MNEVARGATGAADHDFRRAGVRRVHEFPYQRGDHVAGFRLEIVARPIKIRGNQEHAVKTVLLPVRLRLNKWQALGDSVNRARWVRKSLEQVLLAQRHRCIRWVGTSTADA